MTNILSDLANGAKRLQQINKEMSELDLREEILSLRTLLMDAREAVMQKDEEIASLKEKLVAKAQTVNVGGFTYERGDDGNPVGLPFCSACLATDGTQIRPALVGSQMYLCPRCKAAYKRLPHN